MPITSKRERQIMAISTILADQVCQHKLVSAEFDMHDTRKCCLQGKANIFIKLQKKKPSKTMKKEIL